VDGTSDEATGPFHHTPPSRHFGEANFGKSIRFCHLPKIFINDGLHAERSSPAVADEAERADDGRYADAKQRQAPGFGNLRVCRIRGDLDFQPVAEAVNPPVSLVEHQLESAVVDAFTRIRSLSGPFADSRI